MKKILLAALVLLGTGTLFGQVVIQGVDINQLPQVKFCEIVGFSLFGPKVTINVDYGQEREFWGKAQTIQNAAGTNMKFNSMVDALNFMDKNGWQFVNNYVVTNGTQNVYHYLLRKKE